MQHCYEQKDLMNFDEFCNLFNLSGKVAKRVFDFFDMDENGKIDSFEFICGLAFLSKTDLDDRLRSVFIIIDPDNNGSCSLGEMNELFEIAFRVSSREKISDEEIARRLDSIKNNYFLDENHPCSLDQFSEIMLMDTGLKQSLIEIGIFSKEEAEHQNHDNDLQMEIAKFDTANKFNDYVMQGRHEADLSKTVDKGILDAFAEDLKELEGQIEIRKTTESAVPDELSKMSNMGDTPNVAVKLEHVYGYRCHDTRNNIFLNPDGKIILHASQTGIQLDPSSRHQKFIMQSTNDIVSIDSYEEITATGEIAESPVLCLWNNQTMEIEAMYSDLLSQGISHVRFSMDGSVLLVATLDDQKTYYLLSVDALRSGEKQSRHM